MKRVLMMVINNKYLIADLIGGNFVGCGLTHQCRATSGRGTLDAVRAFSRIALVLLGIGLGTA